MAPPFIPNPDAFRCLQCTLLMALRHLGIAEHQGAPLTLEHLDALTHRRPGEGTWTHAAYLALGTFDSLESLAYDTFDYEAFVDSPVKTLFDAFPPGAASQMASGFDLIEAASLAARLIESPPLVLNRAAPTLGDIDRLLDEGWLLIANVDAAQLSGQGLPSGHSVLLYARTQTGYFLHDPGTQGSGHQARHLDREHFERAWTYLGIPRRELIALRSRQA